MDGQTVKVPRNRLKEYLDLSSNFSKTHGFETEFVKYKLYSRRDVNNYISQKYEVCDDSHVWYNIPEKDQLKSKGDFVIDTPLQKGVDKKIIAIALQNYFIHNKSIKDTIMNHTNIYDFCTAMRTDPKFITEYHYLKDNRLQIDTMQKTNRYYISKRGGSLFKVDKKENKYINYCVGRQVTIFNDFIDKPMKEYDIDYGYYISETQKIIDLIIPPQLTLF